MNRFGPCVRVVLMLLVIVLLLLAMASQIVEKGSSRAARFPESRSYSPGAMWLKWSEAERTGFVRGFIVGHDDGFRSACLASVRTKGSSNIDDGTDPCLGKLHPFMKEVSYYERFTTDFYNRYPDDQDVPLRILLLQEDQRTAPEVHQWLATDTR